MKDKVKSGILGLAVGDALGVPVEFTKREDLIDSPVMTMTGYGTYHMPEGTWSDDTSMTLCMLDSLKDGLHYDDMIKRFTRFMDHGEYTPYGKAFDIGATCEQAIMNYKRGRKPLECGGIGKNDNGNGSLMRILPMAYYIVGAYGYDCPDNVAFPMIHNASALTHRHMRSQIACGIYVMIAISLLKEGNLNYAIQSGIRHAIDYYSTNKYAREELVYFKRINSEHFKEVQETEIRSTGYVVDTLEAAIWCLLTTNTYKDCVLQAVNLGNDTDTVAAVAGGLAGIAYGLRGIPKEWLSTLKRREDIETLCEKFIDSMYGVTTRRLENYKEVTLEEEDQACVQEDTPFAYPVYGKEVNTFLSAIMNSCYWTTHYVTVLEKKKIRLSEQLNDIIKNEDDETLGAIATGLIRQERFHEGLIGEAIKHRTFYQILNRLEELHPTKSID